MRQTASVLRDDLYSRLSGWDTDTDGEDIPRVDLSGMSKLPDIALSSVAGDSAPVITMSSWDSESASAGKLSQAKSTRITAAIDIVSSVKPRATAETFLSLQEWEGIVLDIEGDTFVARLTDITARGNPEEEADFPVEDLSKDDIKLFQPGAVFRWIIGYDIKKDGSKRRASQIIFRRLPQWTKREIKAADAEAHALVNAIVWE